MAQTKMKLAPLDELIGIADSLKSALGNKNFYDEIRMAPLQRGYEWTKSNVTSFFEDVFNDSETVYETQGPGKPGKFYGVLIFIEGSATSNGITETYCEVVDGQQRITTIYILGTVLKDHLQAIKGDFDLQVAALTDAKFRDELQAKANSEFNSAIALLQPFLLKSDNVTPRLKTWGHLQHLVTGALYTPRCHVDNKGIIKARDSKGQTKAFALAIETLRELTQKKIENSKSDFLQNHPLATSEELLYGQIKFIYHFASCLLEKSFIVKLWSDAPKDGNAAFLSLNSKGKALGTKDIVKALLLSHLPGAQTEANWSTIVSNVGDVDQYLRIFWMLYKHEKLTLDGLAISIGEYLSSPQTNVGQSNAQDMLTKALAFSDRYSSIVQENKNQHFSNDDFTQTRLNQLAQTAVNYRVFLMKAKEIVTIAGSSHEALLDNAVRLCSIMSFTFVGKYQYPQAVEDMYFQLAEDSIDLSTLTVQINKLHDLVYESCKNLQLKSLKISNALGILFHLEEATRVNIPLATLKWKTMNESVEHIAPQTSTPEWLTSVGLTEKYEDMTPKAGNLTILNRKANSGIKQKPWLDPKDPTNPKKSKKTAFANSTDFRHTLDLASLPNWTDELIEKRTEWIHFALLEISNPANGNKPNFDKFSVWLSKNP